MLAVAALLALSACGSLPRTVSASGTVLEVHGEKGYLLAYFPCVAAKPNRPCGDIRIFDLSRFPGAYPGMALEVVGKEGKP